MNTNELLTNVRVASPCSARWSHMAGDDRVRHCLQCHKHVYNFSAMTTEEVARLVGEREGKLCARFYRRADGTMLTADCPMGTAGLWRAVKSRFAAATALLVVGACVAAGWRTADQSLTPRRASKLTILWVEAKLKVQGWLGYNPRQQFIMGEIYVPPPKVLPQQQSPKK